MRHPDPTNGSAVDRPSVSQQGDQRRHEGRRSGVVRHGSVRAAGHRHRAGRPRRRASRDQPRGPEGRGQDRHGRAARCPRLPVGRTGHARGHPRRQHPAHGGCAPDPRRRVAALPARMGRRPTRHRPSEPPRTVPTHRLGDTLRTPDALWCRADRPATGPPPDAARTRSRDPHGLGRGPAHRQPTSGQGDDDGRTGCLRGRDRRWRVPRHAQYGRPCQARSAGRLPRSHRRHRSTRARGRDPAPGNAAQVVDRLRRGHGDRLLLREDP